MPVSGSIGGIGASMSTSLSSEPSMRGVKVARDRFEAGARGVAAAPPTACICALRRCPDSSELPPGANAELRSYAVTV